MNALLCVDFTLIIKKYNYTKNSIYLKAMVTHSLFDLKYFLNISKVSLCARTQ